MRCRNMFKNSQCCDFFFNFTCKIAVTCCSDFRYESNGILVRGVGFFFFRQISTFLLAIFITRPNCALDRSSILSLYVPGYQRQVLKHVPKCKWFPQTKFQWIPYTLTCNVNFVGRFVLLWIPQQANIASCSGFRNYK